MASKQPALNLLGRYQADLLRIAAAGAADPMDEAAVSATTLLMLLRDGQPPAEVAHRLACSESRVQRIKRRFLVHGLAGLREPQRLSHLSTRTRARQEAGKPAQRMAPGSTTSI